MTVTQLHAQAALWSGRSWRFAVLVLEGRAPDSTKGDTLRINALNAVVRARGLPLVTDLDEVSLRPVPGWRVRICEAGKLAVEWPHFRPLLPPSPLTVPDGWHDTATGHGVVLVFVGFDLRRHEFGRSVPVNTARSLRRTAREGHLSGGAVVVAGCAEEADALDGTTSRPRHRSPHRTENPVHWHERVGRRPGWATRHRAS